MLGSRLRGRKLDEAGFGSEKAEIVLSRDRKRWTRTVSRGALLYGDLVNEKLRCLRMTMVVKHGKKQK
jgi:hypothetical protein